jgi:nicotinate-nucleotide pyrophosphorylase (carboxylating)
MLDTHPIRKLIRLAIEEDLNAGDLTAELTVPSDHRSKARIVAREQLVVCGLPIVRTIFSELQWDAEIMVQRPEGSSAGSEEILVELAATTRHLLAAERTILNFLQRLSGVATYTQRAVAAAGGITVLDTRKTMPGWRALDKYAVRVGGGRSHRANLSEMILVKNNHIDANGGSIPATLKRVMEQKPLYMPVEVEVRNQKELIEALRFQPEIVMLDNMNDEAIKEAIAIVKDSSPMTKIEVSGGLKPERCEALRKLGVSCISMGALTTQARNVDISLRIG